MNPHETYMVLFNLLFSIATCENLKKAKSIPRYDWPQEWASDENPQWIQSVFGKVTKKALGWGIISYWHSHSEKWLAVKCLFLWFRRTTKSLSGCGTIHHKIELPPFGWCPHMFCLLVYFPPGHTWKFHRHKPNLVILLSFSPIQGCQKSPT